VTSSLDQEVKSLKQFFDKSTGVFLEKDSGFAPKDGMFTVAQHVAHAAQAIDWFIVGAFRKEGFDTDFPRMEQEVRNAKSLKKARAWMDDACKRAMAVLKTKSPADMKKKITGALMTGEPRSAIMPAMTDHTAHHRGALTIYARLLGRVPPMPYV
jgi:uncharacterized damage-inducible protein DinB